MVRCSIPVTPWQTILAVLPHRPILALITHPHSLRTTRMIITAAILRTIRPKPPQITLALILRLTKTLSMVTDIVTRTNTRRTSIPDVPLPTLTTERAISVSANCLWMAIMQTKTTLIHIGAVIVSPTSIGDPQHHRAIHLGIAKITLDTHPRHRIRRLITPPTTQRAQTIIASGVMRAILATLLRFRGVHIVVLNRNEWIRLIQPFPTQPKLILAGVHRKTKTLLRGFTPNTTALLL